MANRTLEQLYNAGAYSQSIVKPTMDCNTVWRTNVEMHWPLLSLPTPPRILFSGFHVKLERIYTHTFDLCAIIRTGRKFSAFQREDAGI